MKKIFTIAETLVSPVLVSATLGLLMADPVLAGLPSSPSPLSSDEAQSSEILAAPIDEQVLADSHLIEEINSVANLETSADANAPTDGMEQITSVSQLTDVRPTDWAFQALQSLVERYGCIVGYPDRTFRGNRAITRYEFAAGLNSCMDKIQELIAAGTADLVRKEDLDRLNRLINEFGDDLAVIRRRIDNLDAKTAILERQQFSTTTKLFGQAIVGFQGRNSAEVELAGIPFDDDSNQLNVISNVQLSLFTQFSERSLLFTGLQAGSGRSFGNQLLTNDVLLGYESDTRGEVQLSDLTYRQLVGNNLALVAGALGVNMVNVFRGPNRIESAGQGPLSRFAQRNPILNIGGDGAGAGFDWQINDWISLQGVYTANRPNLPNDGLFGGENGSRTVGAQLTLAPTNSIDIALHYANSYSPSGFLGTSVGDDQLALPNPFKFPEIRAPLMTNAFGATLAWRVSPRFTVGGWAGYTTSDLKGFSGSVETLNWMAFLNFPDLLLPGNLGAIYVGQPPRIISSDLPIGRNVPDFVNEGGVGDEGGQKNVTTHVEAFYRFNVSDNISLTPGVIFIFNPRHNNDNDMITIGILRTTFTF
ncbi:iron uptake porin [Pantanalinema rosaneae CENA516]|uniref:iron uptake porin n=1 Tax=Pantanalinema rosaneae TaxID=1620701 RepID=UPI003D6E8018